MKTVPQLPITECPEGEGSFNTPAGGNGLPTPPPSTYVAPELCIGEFKITQDECADPENTFQESLAAESLSVSGASVNIFKLLGVHEQGRLVDLTGEGTAISSSGTAANAFDSLAGDWVSVETGGGVQSTAYIGYDFGVRKTSYGQNENAPSIANARHITSIRLTQGPSATTRVRQIRVDRSDGGYQLLPSDVLFTGSGNGTITSFLPGYESIPGAFMLVATAPTTFSVAFTSSAGTQVLGTATVGARFNSSRGSFTITAGSTPFSIGDSFSAGISLAWYRVDVVNVPDVPVSLVSIRQSAASRYWRIVPLMFAGTSSGDPWVIQKLELFDYQSTRLDNIQDTVFMENRDRDYANQALTIKCSFTPFDGQSDLSKFGFQVPDVYIFTCSFAEMVKQLGRPVVVGDVLEVPSELQYDHNLRPVHKFLEVSDVGWSAEGYTTGWKPILYRFTAQQLIPSQEHRDILGTADTQKYVIDDGSFFTGIEQIQTSPLTVTENNQAEAVRAVPEKGTSVRETASGTNRFNAPGTYDGVGPYVEDGLPPDGQPYTEGFKLPDVGSSTDGQFYRLNYPPETKIPARLYKFSAYKNKWIYVETDRRAERSAHRPSQRAIFNLEDQRPLGSKL